MIRYFIFILLALTAGAWLAIALMNDPGYVTITFQDYYLRTTLVFAVLFLVTVFLALGILSRFLKLLGSLFRR